MVHPSNWPFAKQALNTLLAMSQQAFFALLSHRNSEKTFFPIFTTFHIWGGLPPGLWCLLGLSGEGSPPTSTPSRKPESTASRPRFTCHTCLQLQPVPIPERRFSHLHIDWVGPLQYSSSCNFIFTVIDRTSKWVEVIPLSDTSAAACTKA